VKKLAIALLAVSLAACHDNNNVVTPLLTVPGTYVLQTINGSKLPFTFSDGVTLNSDVLVLKNDGTFTETMKLADGRVFTDTGTYTANNNALTFVDETAGFSYAASLSGTTLTAIFPNGLTEVFFRN
jgi:hypothetical protein